MDALVEAIGEDSAALAGATEMLVLRYLFLTDPDAFIVYINDQLRAFPRKKELFANLYGNWLEEAPGGVIQFNSLHKQRQEIKRDKLSQSGFYSQQ